jgi:hypothetical protein
VRNRQDEKPGESDSHPPSRDHRTDPLYQGSERALLVYLDLAETVVSWHMYIPSRFQPRIGQINEADFSVALGESTE